MCACGGENKESVPDGSTPKAPEPAGLARTRALCRAATTIPCRLGGDAVRPGMPDGADVRGREDDGAVAPLAPPNVFLPDNTRIAIVHRLGEERRRREREASGSVLRVFGGRRQLKRRRLLLRYAVGCLAAAERGDWSSSGGQTETSTSKGGGGSNRKFGESVFQLYSTVVYSPRCAVGEWRMAARVRDLCGVIGEAGSSGCG